VLGVGSRGPSGLLPCRCGPRRASGLAASNGKWEPGSCLHNARHGPVVLIAAWAWESIAWIAAAARPLVTLNSTALNHRFRLLPAIEMWAAPCLRQRWPMERRITLAVRRPLLPLHADARRAGCCVWPSVPACRPA